jgi:predicted XRE-type DNA-binding protein
VPDCCGNFFYSFELQGVRRIRKHKTKPRKPKIYVNPITQAMDYKHMMKQENLSQIELARKLGISRVRVTQYIKLLRLSKAQLDYIMQNGKEEKITERKLRNKSK